MDKRYKAGVIGRTGRGDYGHGLDIAYLQMEDVDIVAVADDDPVLEVLIVKFKVCTLSHPDVLV